MLRKLQIRNFRCLREVDLDLEPLTVFVGANASGKSSVFAALSSPMNASDTWARQAAQTITVKVSRDGARWVGRAWSEAGGNVRLTDDFPSVAGLRLELDRLRAHNDLQESRQLGPDGYQLTNLFASLPRKQQDAAAQQLCSFVPLFSDVGTRPSANGRHRLVFQDRWHPEVWYEPDQVSDGTILVLAYLLLSYWSPPPEVVTIEEPERGLHPYLLGQLVDTLRSLAEGRLGPQPVQILLATHSAELLEFVRPEEVRFFSRSTNTGETVVRTVPSGDPSWRTSLREYDDSLGDLWLSGGLGGVPGS